MPDLKISQLNNGDPAQTADQIPINRTGVNFSITAGSIASLATTNSADTEILFNDGGTVNGDPNLTFNKTGGIFSLIGQLNVDNLRFDGNTIVSTDANGNIAITPNGTGEVDISKVDIDSGAIDGTTIGANSAAAGTFTNVTANGTINLTGATVSNLGSFASSVLAAAVTDETGSGSLVFGTNPTISGATITGGTINNTPIGATTRAAGNFTSLDANGNVVLGDSTADTIDANGRFISDLVPSADDTYDLGTSTLRWRQVYAVTFTEGGYPVATQLDIGTAPNQIPLNQYLGALAYEDTETPALDMGTGITTGTGTICRANGGLMGGIYQMTILIDLTGLNSGGTAGDIIGVDGTALPCYIARLPAMTVLGGRMTCFETPAGGDTDIDLYAATEGTGVEDQAITALTETQIINAGTQTAGTVTYFSADPAANAYFYLVGQGTANATYTAGRFLIEIFGVQ